MTEDEAVANINDLTNKYQELFGMLQSLTAKLDVLLP